MKEVSTITNDLFGDYKPHLEELRSRLVIALFSLIVAVAGSFVLAPTLLQILTAPIGGLDKLQSIEVTENISVFMRVSLLSGFIVALPVILYQILSFTFPGLTKNEKRWVMLSIPAATILFVSGVVFTYLVMLPTAIPFLIGFLGIQTVPRVSNYIEFVTGLLFWVGVCFEAPMVAYLLAKLKLISGRMLLKQWRIALVIIAIVAAFVTPTGDPINMGLLMLPLLMLYFLSILLALIARRQ